MYESLIVMLSGIIVYGVVYQFYVKWFDKNVVQADPTKPTPAHTYMDGVEFFPSNKYVMLGWHWKSIAALGPVTGPAVAIVWGWLPGLLWILIGNSLMGWLHDYNSVMASVKNEGASLGPLTYQLIGPRARKVLVWFLAFYTILILAAFIGTLLPVIQPAASATAKNPAPNLGPMMSFLILSVIGVVSGYAVFKAKVNVLAVTAISLLLIAVSVYAVQVLWASSINSAFLNAVPDWLTRQDIILGIMLIFSILGAVLPIWSFAMPINYLGFYVAYFVIIAIFGSAVFVPQTFQQPMFTSLFAPLTFGAGAGAFLFSFPLWPLMFVTIACGACSGWHGLIGSSLSSKQLDNESDAHFVGGGAMLLEGILGLTSVVAVASLAPSATTGILKGLGLYITGGAKYLANVGLGGTVGTGIMGLMGLVLGLTLTQLALRFARLAIAEMTGVRVFKNIYVTSIVAALITYVLISNRLTPTGFWGFIWALFGGSNQLLAGVTLLVTTVWLTKAKRPNYFTGIPAVFMLGTTITALAYTAYATFQIGFTAAGTKAFGTTVTSNIQYGSEVAGVIAIILTVLGLILVYDGFNAFRRVRSGAGGGAPEAPSPSTPAVSSPARTTTSLTNAAEISKAKRG
jgi:carbon starvation protein